MREQGKTINKNLYGSHAFKNPDILEKIIQYMNIQEIGTNYPKNIFDPHTVHDEDYYDNLGIYFYYFYFSNNFLIF